MPSIESLHRRSGEGNLKVLTISVAEEPEVVEKFMAEHGYTFPVLLDPGFVSQMYGVRQHPMKFLVDPDGRLVAYSIGYGQWDVPQMDALARELAGSEAP